MSTPWPSLSISNYFVKKEKISCVDTTNDDLLGEDHTADSAQETSAGNMGRKWHLALALYYPVCTAAKKTLV